MSIDFNRGNSKKKWDLVGPSLVLDLVGPISSLHQRWGTFKA